MFVFFAWCVDDTAPAPLAAIDARVQFGCSRVERAVADLVPTAWTRRMVSGQGLQAWMAYPPMSQWRWDLFLQTPGLAVVSLGVPVGLQPGRHPIDVGRRLLAGEDVHADVVPPFGMLAVESSRFALQTDWLGMCRIYESSSDGVRLYSNRPSLHGIFRAGRVRPDPSGWRQYTASGHFGADSSPIAGVRLFDPGERVVGERHDQTWTIKRELRFNVDTIVAAADKPANLQELVEVAGSGLTRVARSLSAYQSAPVTLGLSGGKDSRLIAAAFVAAGVPPQFSTNEDTAAEGQTARHLTDILARSRRMDVDHRFYRAGAPAVVTMQSLAERARALLRTYDCQFPSTYLNRPASRSLPANVRATSLSGAAGEIATGYWYPRDVDLSAVPDGATIRARLDKFLGNATPRQWQRTDVRDEHDCQVERLFARATHLGLIGYDILDYSYLIERTRRWVSSAYLVGTVTPLLTPEFVTAAFSMTAQQKASRSLHQQLIGNLIPEWRDIPFVSVSTGRRRSTRVWEGDGLHLLRRLVECAQGDLSGLLDRSALLATVERVTVGRGTHDDETALQQFTMLVYADERLSGIPAPTVPEGFQLRRLCPSEPPLRRAPTAARRLARRLPSPARAALRRIVTPRYSGHRVNPGPAGYV